MISLVVTIVVLLIMAVTVTVGTTTVIELRQYNDVKVDIIQLNETVSDYYTKNESLPILNKYTNIAKLASDKNPNDGADYYIIDVTELGDISLNRGQGNFKNDISSSDVYVINEQSHTIYYMNGVILDKQRHYTIVDSDSAGNMAGDNYKKITLPLISVVSMQTNGINNEYAKNGTVVTVTIKFNYPLTKEPTVTIGGKAAVVSGTDLTRIATYHILENESALVEGKLPISISEYQADGRTGNTITDVTVGNGVIYDRTVPQNDAALVSVLSKDTSNAKVQVSLKDNNKGVGIDDANSKYILTTSSVAIGTNLSNWTNMPSIGSANSVKSFSINENTTYFLHVLSVDKAGNAVEFITKI